MNIIFNRDIIAIPARLQTDATSLPYDVIETFGTEYGLFIPTAATGWQFLRWVKRGAIDPLPAACSLSTYFLHIANDGEMSIAYAGHEPKVNSITLFPYASQIFAMMCEDRDTGEGFGHLIRNCKTVQEAVTIVEDNNMRGMYDPKIFFVSDWVAHAKEKGYDKIFYHTEFPVKK